MLVCCIRYLATGSTDACIALWDVEDMVCVRTFASMDNEVNNLSFTPDGRHISYFDKLAGLSILDVETGAVPPRYCRSGHAWGLVPFVLADLWSTSNISQDDLRAMETFASGLDMRLPLVMLASGDALGHTTEWFRVA